MKAQEKIKMAKKFECEENGFLLHGEDWKKDTAGGYTRYWVPGKKKETFFMTHVAAIGINVFDEKNIHIGNTNE